MNKEQVLNSINNLSRVILKFKILGTDNLPMTLEQMIILSNDIKIIRDYVSPVKKSKIHQSGEQKLVQTN